MNAWWTQGDEAARWLEEASQGAQEVLTEYAAEDREAACREQERHDIEDAFRRCYANKGTTADWLLMAWAAGVDARCLSDPH